MNSFVISQIRTYVPIAVGALVAWLLSQGIVLDEQATAGLVIFLTGLLQAIYYFAVRLLESRYPSLGILLGAKSQPKYKEVK